MTSPAASETLQALLDRHVARGTAPGLVAVAFDRTTTLASAASGVSSISAPQKPMTLDTPVWLASTSKPIVSLAALLIVEERGFDLDSHEALVEVVPELGRDWPGTRVWTLWDGKDGEGGYKVKPAEKGITLRHLLTHTSGLTYNFTSEEHAWLDAEAAKAGQPVEMGALKNYNIPRLFEAGERYHYGCQNGYIALFIMRSTGLSLRRALWDLVLSPLSIAPDTLDIYFPPSRLGDIAEVALRTEKGTFVSPPQRILPPLYEDAAPEGYVPLADGAFIGTLPALASFLQSLLNGTAPPGGGGNPLLSREMWEKASADDLKSRGFGVGQRPFLKSPMEWFASSVEKWTEPKEREKVEDDSLGWSLMQTLVHRYEMRTKSGLHPGTLEWAGIANTYYFLDPASGLGGVISAQFVPFGTEGMRELKEEFFRWVVENAAKK